MNLTAIIMITAGFVPFFFALRKLRLGMILLSGAAGIASLCAADLLMSFCQLNLPVNPFTVACSAIGGVPGTILLLLLNVLLASG